MLSAFERTMCIEPIGAERSVAIAERARCCRSNSIVRTGPLESSVSIRSVRLMLRKGAG